MRQTGICEKNDNYMKMENEDAKTVTFTMTTKTTSTKIRPTTT